MSHPKHNTLEFCNLALESSAKVFNTWLSGIERMHDTQQQALRTALSDQSEAMRKLESVKSVPDLLALQGTALREQMTKASAYCTDLLATCSLNQMESLRQIQAKVLDMVNGLEKALAAVPPTGAEPIVSTMKLAVDAARSSCATSMRVTEAATQQAVTRLESVRKELESSFKGAHGKSAHSEMKRAA